MTFTSLALSESDLLENINVEGNIAGTPFLFYRVEDLILISDPNDLSHNITLFYGQESTLNEITFTLLAQENATFPFTSKELGKEWTIAFSQD